MKGIFRVRSIEIILLACVLLLFCTAIIIINFGAAPSFFDADMYCDYRYAIEAWEHKSLFPEGWVFGNQLNVISTPVLAALIYGLSSNPNFSIAAACTIMAFLVLYCFNWILVPILKSLESRLLALALLLGVVLFYGTAISGNQGWNLFFTMCSYYAGYSVSAFLSFGSYLRALDKWDRKFVPVVLIACILSFGTGIQSIRQTIIMVVPLVVAEVYRFLLSPKNYFANKIPLWLMVSIVISNLLGLIYVYFLDINQVTIYGEINFFEGKHISNEIYQCLLGILHLLSNGTQMGKLVILVLAVFCIVAILQMLRGKAWYTERKAQAILILLGTSIPTIIFIDIFLAMNVRPRYYFMIFPLMCFLTSYLYEKCKKTGKFFIFALSMGFLLLSIKQELPAHCLQAFNKEQEDSYAVAEYLINNGYNTIYSRWDFGEDIAVASNGQIITGFWQEKEDAFERIEMLCDPTVYTAQPAVSAYIFEGKQEVEAGIKIAETKNITVKLLGYYPNSDIYVYSASASLISDTILQ